MCQGTLTGLASAASAAPESFRPHASQLIASVVERLGDGKAPVRDAARDFMIILMRNGVLTPSGVLERASTAWAHKNWHVREEVRRGTATVTFKDSLTKTKQIVRRCLRFLPRH